MTRYVFSAGSVSNSTGAPLVLKCYRSNTSTEEFHELNLVDGNSDPGAAIPNGRVVTNSSGNYPAFFGPEGIQSLWIGRPGGTRTQLTSSTADSAVYLTQATAASTYAAKTESVNTVSAAGATRTIPDPGTSPMNQLTLTANCTLTFPSATAGASFDLVLIQGGTGSYLVTWPAAAKWAGGVVPTLSTTVGAVDWLTFACVNGTTWAGFVAGLDIK